jgi:hypothetical protein
MFGADHRKKFGAQALVGKVVPMERSIPLPERSFTSNTTN